MEMKNNIVKLSGVLHRFTCVYYGQKKRNKRNISI